MVSRLCEEIDERVDAFLERPVEGEWPYLWIDATYLKVCQNGRIVPAAHRINPHSTNSLERVPALHAAFSRSRNRRRNSMASGLTARKMFARPAGQLVPPGERPPPGTTQWTCPDKCHAFAAG